MEKFKSIIMISVIALLLSACSIKECQPQVINAKISSVYYQPKGFGASEKWSGSAYLQNNLEIDSSARVEFSTQDIVQGGDYIYMLSGCGYFPVWHFNPTSTNK